LLSVLNKIIVESKSTVRVFDSSGDDGDIVCRLENSPSLFIQAGDDSADISRYPRYLTTKYTHQSTLLVRGYRS
jgi:hypothetical protein